MAEPLKIQHNLGDHLTEIMLVSILTCAYENTPNECPPAAVSLEPRHQTVRNNASVTIKADMYPKGEYRFQWYFEQKPVAGATNDVIVISQIKADQGGTYSVIVKTHDGSFAIDFAFVDVAPDFVLVTKKGRNAGIQITGEPGFLYTVEHSRQIGAKAKWKALPGLTKVVLTERIQIFPLKGDALSTGFYRLREEKP
ncbi:MAG: hypothetical protein HYV68_01615 [Candidatus Taylorbacteria bacterium]|nr:hypothetical protein [Candidatus Taylorbacteria bacterium]